MSGGREQSARSARAIYVLIAVVPLAAVMAHCGTSPTVPWIVSSERAPWVMPDRAVSADLEQWGDPEPAVTRYAARLDPRRVAPDARLELRALGDVVVRWGDAELGRLLRAGPRGRAQGTIAVPEGTAGVLRVDVVSATGPGLLAFASEGIEPAVSSASPLVAARGDEPGKPAVRADDTRINPRALAVDTPLEALGRVAPTFATLALFGTLGFLLWRQLFGANAGAVFGGAAPVVATALWLGPVAARFVEIPLDIGFDATHHLLYVDTLLERGALPSATEGWSTYHPPLFFAVAALVRGAGGGAEALHWIGILAGVAAVWIAWAIARALRPASPESAGLAALFAAVLPVHLTSAAYFSNEAFHATLAGAGLWAVVAALRAPRVTPLRLCVVGVVLGAAILTKFTALVLVPIAAFFVAWRLVTEPGGSLARGVAGASALLATVALVGGGFYLRTWLEHGTPLLGNWELPGADQQWWQQPGFHTPAYYLGFGEALRHPYLAGFASFWDALYSTGWGDGYIAGGTDPWRRHAFWSWDFMTAGYALALPATAALLLGFGVWARRVWRESGSEESLAGAFLLTVSWGVGLAFATLTFRLAFFAQAKAAYGLMLTAPFALAFAAGALAVDRALSGVPALRALWAGGMVATAAVLALGFAG